MGIKRDETKYVIVRPGEAPVFCLGREDVESRAGQLISTGPAVEIYHLEPVHFETETRTHVRLIERSKDDTAKAC